MEGAVFGIGFQESPGFDYLKVCLSLLNEVIINRVVFFFGGDFQKITWAQNFKHNGKSYTKSIIFESDCSGFKFH